MSPKRPLVLTVVAASVIVAPAALFAQGQGASKGQAAPGANTSKTQAAPRPSQADLAKLNEVVATVNGEKITRGKLLQLLSRYPIAPGTEKAAYSTALDILINTRLLVQFLNEKKVKVDEAEIDKMIDESRKAEAQNGSSLESALADSGITLDQVKEQFRDTLRWRNYIEAASSPKTLAEYMKANPDVFNGTLVRASHIQISVDEDAPAADKQKAKDRLVAIKKEIQSGKISFADAANKYSEDPTTKEQPSGGDLNWFPRKARFTDKFAEAAFALKKGEISDPVETEWGYHLIYVTDRREGKMPTLEQVQEKVKAQYAEDEQNRIVADMRKKAKIDIKPMPADFFPAPPEETKAADTAKSKASDTTKTKSAK